MSKAKPIIAIIKDAEKLVSLSTTYTISNPAEITSIVSDLKETLRANKDLMALSAPQIGRQARIFCIRFSDGDIRAFVNPMITKIQGKCLMIENLNDSQVMIQRPDRILATYQSVTGKVEADVSLKNPIASIFEQMVDILDGILFFKYEMFGLPIDENYYKAPQEQKDELHKWYLETYVPGKYEELNKVAENDEEIKKTRDAIKFMSSVINGETEVVPEINNELDFSKSSLKVKEAQDKVQKSYEDKLKKKFGIK